MTIMSYKFIGSATLVKIQLMSRAYMWTEKRTVNTTKLQLMMTRHDMIVVNVCTSRKLDENYLIFQEKKCS